MITMAKRENNAHVLVARTSVRASIREGWRRVCAGLRHVRDWPDPDSPYSPLMTVFVAALFVLTAIAFR